MEGSGFVWALNEAQQPRQSLDDEHFMPHREVHMRRSGLLSTLNWRGGEATELKYSATIGPGCT